MTRIQPPAKTHGGDPGGPQGVRWAGSIPRKDCVMGLT